MDSSESKSAGVLTLNEAAALLGLHPNTVRNLATRGVLPGGKVGRGWRFITADLLDGIRAQYAIGQKSPLESSQSTMVSPDLTATSSGLPGSNAWTEATLDALFERKSADSKPSER
jgi:excisionase family DNA binding protein